MGHHRGEEKEVVASKPKVAIVGYGRVGRVLARAFPAAGYEVAAVVTRRSIVPPRADQLPIINSVAALPSDVEFVILSVRDSEIERVAGEFGLPLYDSRGGIRGGKILCHTAGAVPAEVLAPARRGGWSVMAWHPLQTFTGDEGPELLKGITFGIDGDEEAVEVGERVARDLGGLPFRVPPELRLQYHLGAVFACNLLAALVGVSLDLLREVGMDQCRALLALEPLLKATAGNIARMGLADAITGPLRRGDAEIIQSHLQILESHSDAAQIYKMLSRALLERLSDLHNRGELLRILNGD